MAGEAIGWGGQFHLKHGSGGSLTKLLGVFDMQLPNYQADQIETTNYDSPGRRREYIAGLIETGTGDVQMNYVPGSATDLLCTAALDSGAVCQYKIVLPDATGDPAWEITGDCVVVGYERAIPVDDRLTATLTVKWSGAATEAAPV